MALTKITKSGLGNDAIDSSDKLADGVISEEHLDTTVITGNTELAEAAAGTDVLLVYDASAGTIKKIQASNVGLQAPTISSVSPTSVTSGDGTGNYTFTITGSGYVASAVPTLITNSGSSISFDSFTIDSSTQITAVIAKANLGTSGEPYDVKVTTAGALNATLENQINVDQSPVFNTASGSVGSFSEQTTISTIDIEAYDPDSAGNVTFEIQSGSLPAGLSATTVNENGVSKYRITGTLTTNVSAFTTTNFTLRAVDAASNTSSRAFSITEIPSAIESFTSSGTFSVPTGITSVDVLVVGSGGGSGNDFGGGGGAGGLIFIPNYPVTPGGTVTVTVGCGGAGGAPGSPNGVNAGYNGQDSVFGDLTAKGGGGGGGGNAAYDGNPGGSGGGGSGHGTNATPSTNTSGQGIQPTQPGQSGAYGFGNGGGFGIRGPATLNLRAGGGGGAGAAGSPGQTGCSAGGDGKAYTIADGTTPVYYAGGGAGSHYAPGPEWQSKPGGQGGGGNSKSPSAPQGQAGQANKGGGGGADQGAGGKGIVIVSY